MKRFIICFILSLIGLSMLMQPAVAYIDQDLDTIEIYNPFYHMFIDTTYDDTTMIQGRYVQTPKLISQDNTVDMTESYYGIYNKHIKTEGITDGSDILFGMYNYVELNDADQTLPMMFGLYNSAKIAAGTLSNNIYGLYHSVNITGGVIQNDVYGAQMHTTSTVDVAGSFYGLHVATIATGTIAEKVYGIYIGQSGQADWGIYTIGAAPCSLSGDVYTGGAFRSVYDISSQVGAYAHGIKVEHTRTANIQPVTGCWFGGQFVLNAGTSAWDDINKSAYAVQGIIKGDKWDGTHDVNAARFELQSSGSVRDIVYILANTGTSVSSSMLYMPTHISLPNMIQFNVQSEATVTNAIDLVSGVGSSYNYGIDFSGATINTAEFKFGNGALIYNKHLDSLIVTEANVKIVGNLIATTYLNLPTAWKVDSSIYTDTVLEGIADNIIMEADLKAVNAAVDEDILTYESTTGDFEWHTPAELSLQGLLVNEAGLYAALSDVTDFVQPNELVLSSFDSETAWRVWYSDAAGDVTELILGADGTFLQSEGASAAPTFGALIASDIPDISATYEVQLNDEAGLYAVLSDVTDFVQPAELVGANEAYGSGWDNDASLPEKDDIYDYLHQIDTDDDGSLIDEAALTGFFEVQLDDEAGLYAVLSDVTDFTQPTEVPGMTSTTVKVVFAFNLYTVADDMDGVSMQFPRAITITKVTMKCKDGTNVIGRLYEVDGDGDPVDKVGVETADWTVTTTETEDTSFNNATFDAGDYIWWETTSVSGTVTMFTVTVEGYET